MKTWGLAPIDGLCGRCGHRIRRDEPRLMLTIDVLKKIRLRCVACAGEPVPTDLPPLVVPPAIIVPTYKRKHAPLFASVGALALDWKAKQAGREPGEDD
jgi:hypothetical protein